MVCLFFIFRIVIGDGFFRIFRFGIIRRFWGEIEVFVILVVLLGMKWYFNVV